MIKKLLAIVVLGLLYSCSNAENNKMKMIEKCADKEMDYESVKLSINEKIQDYDYREAFAGCENLLKKNPETFKAYYILKK